MTTGRLRVLVVDDSNTQRQMLAKLLTDDPDIEGAGLASNGSEAVQAVARLRPDVVTLDDRMPVMGGLEAARQIMSETPTPIVMISAARGEEARRLAADALSAGVLAVQGKRALSNGRADAITDLVRLIKGMATVRVSRNQRGDSNRVDASKTAVLPEVVAIGASTGGPQAIRAILARLPESFRLPILVVQHTVVGYSQTLADWLVGGTQLPVRVAQDGQALDHHGVFVAPTGRHLAVRGRQLALLDTAPVSLHRPSATVLFKSVAASYGARAVGVLLTGMGDDGAAGLLELKRVGAVTIAQDEASSVVFGMPAEAMRVGAVEHALPPSQIATLLKMLADNGGALWT